MSTQCGNGKCGILVDKMGYRFYPYIRLSVCLSVIRTLPSRTKVRRKTKIGVNFAHARSNRCANFQFKRSKVRVRIRVRVAPCSGSTYSCAR